MHELIKKLDEVLDLNGKYASDKKINALIYLDICDLVFNEFNFEQKDEFNVARNYWRSNGLNYDDDRIHALEQLNRRRNKNVMISPFAQNRTQIFDWLLLGALNNGTEFSSYSAEYMINFTDKLAIDKEEIIKIFKRHMPELR